MFWWWQVVDENNLYPRYTAIRKFMDGVDPRDVTAKQAPSILSVDEKGDATLAKKFSAVCIASPEKARGYIHPVRYARAGEPPPVGEHLTLSIDGFTPGVFRVEFFETESCKPVRRFDVRTKDNRLDIPVPKFVSDCAFKLHLLTPVSKR